jgi:hypothetical protein
MVTVWLRFAKSKKPVACAVPMVSAAMIAAMVRIFKTLFFM